MGRVRWAAAPAEIPHLTPTLSAPKGGEGEIELAAYRFQNAPKVFHYIPVPEADYAIAIPADFDAPLLVRFGANRVLSAI